MLRAVFVRTVNEDLTESAQAIACPVLLIWGGDDRETPPWLARRYRELIGPRRRSVCCRTRTIISTPARAPTSARREMRAWLSGSQAMPELLAAARAVAGAPRSCTVVAPAAGVPALLPAGRLRARPVPEAGPTSARSPIPAFWLSLLARSCSLASRPCTAVGGLFFAAGARRSGMRQPDPRRSGKFRCGSPGGRAACSRLPSCLAAARLGVRLVPSSTSKSGAPLIASAVLFAVLPLLLVAANAPADAVRAPRPAAITRKRPRSSVAARAAVHHRHHRQLREEQHEGDARPHPPVPGADARRDRQHQYADGRRRATSAKISCPDTAFMVVEMGAFKTRIDQAALPADTAVGRPHHGCRRHASRTLRVAPTRSSRAKSELAQARAARRAARRERRQPRRAANREARPDSRGTALRRETSAEDLDDAARAGPVLAGGHVASRCRTRDRTLRVLHAALRPPDHPEPGRRIHARVAVGVDPADRCRAVRTLKPVSNRLEVVEETRRHLDSRRLQFEPVRVPRGARGGCGASGHAPLPRDARCHRARAEQYERQPGTLARRSGRVRPARSSCPTPTATAFVAGHQDAGREDRLSPCRAGPKRSAG